jgi:hypothetical protein
MSPSSILLGAVLAAAGPLLANGQALDKPALTPNLDYLEQGSLDNLAPTQSTWDQWGAGWIPQDCKDIANNEGKSPDDFEIYNVHYTDVRCHHAGEDRLKRSGERPDRLTNPTHSAAMHGCSAVTKIHRLT